MFGVSQSKAAPPFLELPLRFLFPSSIKSETKFICKNLSKFK